MSDPTLAAAEPKKQKPAQSPLAAPPPAPAAADWPPLDQVQSLARDIYLAMVTTTNGKMSEFLAADAFDKSEAFYAASYKRAKMK